MKNVHFLIHNIDNPLNPTTYTVLNSLIPHHFENIQIYSSNHKFFKRKKH